MTTEFIHAFRRMHANERDQALKALTTELSPYEWRALHATTSSRTFQCDVIGKLPVELVALIFSHLDVAAPYRLQSVSRQWNHTLRSLHLLKESLGQWYQGTVNLQDADYARCQEKVCKIQAFRTGKPRNVYKTILDSAVQEIYLAGNIFVWKEHSRTQPTRCVYVLDLATWDLRVLGGEARERIIKVVASDEIVALTTWANICYVYELHGSRSCKKFRVSNNGYFSNVACRGSTVACVHVGGDSTSVYIWEYHSQRGWTFQIKHEPGTIFWQLDSVTNDTHAIAPIIQPATQTIVLFTTPSPAIALRPEQCHFAFSRYTYSGECISTHYPCLPGISTVTPWLNTNRFVSVDYKEKILAIRMRDCKEGDPLGQLRSSFLLRFNEEENDLSVWEDSRLSGPGNSMGSGGSMAWWKDTCYGGDQRGMIAYLGTSEGRVHTPIVSESEDVPIAYEWDFINAPIVMNEKYVIRNVFARFYILCFDDDGKGKWPKENGSFFDVGKLEVLKATDT